MFKKLIERYTPKCEQEVVDKALILSFIERNPDCLYRENLVAHITSSAFVVNPEMTKMLFAHHNLYDSWGWVGGHNDGDEDLLHVAIKETMEETGLINVTPFSEEVFTIDVIYVENHIKHGKYVPDHLHLNVAFLLLADERQTLSISVLENSAVKWFEIESILDFVSEPRMIPVYQKALDSIKNIRKGAKF
jgi:ADP-ribose pyrophosphatase YjhB (NUDIX family)